MKLNILFLKQNSLSELTVSWQGILNFRSLNHKIVNCFIFFLQAQVRRLQIEI